MKARNVYLWHLQKISDILLHLLTKYDTYAIMNLQVYADEYENIVYLEAILNSIEKILRTVGVLLLTVLFLVSCASKNDEDMPFISLGSDDKMLITEYRLVVSRSASGELLNAAEELCKALENKTGVESKLSYDEEYFPVFDGTWLMYIGNVDMTESRDRLRSMRSEDYICRSFDRVTVIGGRNDSATVIAIERFIKEILPVSDEYRPIPEGGGFDHFESYDTESLTVGGASISEFEISVTSFDDTASVKLAYELRRELSDTFGFWLDIRVGSRSETGRGIYIGTDRDCREGRGELLFSGNDIFLKAVDTVGLEKLTDMLLQLLKSDGSNGAVEPSIPEHIYVPYGDTTCGIAFASLKYASSLNSVYGYSVLGNMADIHRPNVILLGEVDDSNSKLFTETLYKYESAISLNMGAFLDKNTSMERISVSNKDGLFYEVLSVKCGELEFIVVYISGEARVEVTVDVFDIVGETSLPVVAIAYTKDDTPITLTHSKLPFFEEMLRGGVTLFTEDCSYVCYADVSRLTVIESGANERIGYTQVTVAIC